MQFFLFNRTKKSGLVTGFFAVLFGLYVWQISQWAYAEEVLHLYNWNNYISVETIKRFESHCQCKVIQDYYSDNEEMLAKLAAGASGYDIIVPTGNAIESLIRQHALRPLDKITPVLSQC
jgi:spermidine/putrescine transport system substrate-binding protein